MYMLDESLTTDIFDAVGSRLLRFYEIVAPIETIGACIVKKVTLTRTKVQIDKATADSAVEIKKGDQVAR